MSAADDMVHVFTVETMDGRYLRSTSGVPHGSSSSLVQPYHTVLPDKPRLGPLTYVALRCNVRVGIATTYSIISVNEKRDRDSSAGSFGDCKKLISTSFHSYLFVRNMLVKESIL